MAETVSAKAGMASAMGDADPKGDATRAYDNAAREHFGEHASLNFPEEGERAALGVAA